MGALEIFLVSFGLAMDAFAVAVCKGLALKEMDWKKAVKVGLYFGIFQAGMALIGFLFGNTFSRIVIQIDHWIAFALLSFIGIEMIKEAFSDSSENCNDDIMEIKHEFDEIYGKNCLNKTKAYPGIVELLEILKEHD